MRELKLITEVRYEDLYPEKTPHYGSGTNSMTKLQLPLCNDARKADCPYALNVIVDTPEVSFEQVFCCIPCKKESKYNPEKRILETC